MAICVEAGMNAIRNNRTSVLDEDFSKAIASVKEGRNQKIRPLPDEMYS